MRRAPTGGAAEIQSRGGGQKQQLSVNHRAICVLCQPLSLPPVWLPPCSANDHGLQLLGAGLPGDAFHAFTEAVRLRPTSAVYHCNRAAAALRLGRADVAAEDADAAAQRDQCYAKAHLRAGRARLALEQPAAAAASFQRVLELEPGSAAAAKGLAAAEAQAGRQQQQVAEEEAAATAGSRPALTREAVPEEEAVGQLYAAERMLAANPGLQVGGLGRDGLQTVG